MTAVAAFVAAAAVGAVARAEIGRRLNVHGGFAWGTFVVNVVGSTALGFVHETLGGEAATVVGVGLLGAFTTFSSFVRDAAALLEQERAPLAFLYVTSTLAVCILGAAGGMAVARH